ncbi:MAG: hypothetical protein R3F38_16490 [Gammaproteobacteria bacterium]
MATVRGIDSSVSWLRRVKAMALQAGLARCYPNRIPSESEQKGRVLAEHLGIEFLA